MGNPDTAILRAGLKYEGKTKRVWKMPETDSSVILEEKDDITAFDDPGKTQILLGKGEWCNTTCSRVFELLMRNSIPTAFISQLSATEMICWNCEMLPLEVVVRNIAFGSFLKRFPRYAPSLDTMGFQGLTPPSWELFLKTTEGELKYNGQTIVAGLGAEENDPWIPKPNAQEWILWHSKKPLNDPAGNLRRIVKPQDILQGVSVKAIRSLALSVNKVLRKAWQRLGYTLVDFKIELGITGDGQLVVADVIDADSWRLWNAKGEDFSKQTFRDGSPLAEVAGKYQTVAKLAAELR